MKKTDNIIDRKDEIVAALRAHAKGGDCEEKCVYAKSDDTICADTMCTDAADLVEAQAARIADLEAMVPKWISVEERLPELIPCMAGTAYSEAIFVFTSGRKVMEALYDGTEFIAPLEYWEADGETVTHWMPLPGELPPLCGADMREAKGCD